MKIRNKLKLSEVVEIDETKIGAQKKGPHARTPKGSLQWVFGGFCRSTRLILLEILPNRNA